MMTNPEQIDIADALEAVGASDIFIFAAGFEDRATHIIGEIELLPSVAVVGVKFGGGPSENLRGEASASKLFQKCESSNVCCEFVNFRIEDSASFENSIKKTFRSFKKGSVSHVCVDISGMPQFIILEILAQVREDFPSSKLTCLYVSAREYPPSQTEIRRFLKAKESGKIGKFEFGVRFEPGEPLFPKRFAGVGQRRGKSVMVLFAGYEKDRSHAAYDAVNPAKLLVFHSLPKVSCAKDRLAYSKAVHAELGGRIERSVEVIDNLDINTHVKTLTEYYQWLYDLYDLVLVPVHSKLQAIACFIFWERYPDVQIIFPVPVEYKFSGAGNGVGEIYRISLPAHPGANIFSNSSDLEDGIRN